MGSASNWLRVHDIVGQPRFDTRQPDATWQQPFHQEAATTYTYHYEHVEGGVDQDESLDTMAASYMSAEPNLVPLQTLGGDDYTPTPWEMSLK